MRRLDDLIPNPWQAARMVESFLDKHRVEESIIFQNRAYLSDVIIIRIKEIIDKQAEEIFRAKVKNDEIRFHLEADMDLNYEFKERYEVLVNEDEQYLSKGRSQVQHSLFEQVFESEFNTLEKDFAFYLDKHDSIFWWHKIAARQQYSIQGWNRHRIYPDFVACKKDGNKYLVMETKGMHLKGNLDTNYKEKLFGILEDVYNSAIERGEMKTTGDHPITLKILFQDTWQEELDELL